MLRISGVDGKAFYGLAIRYLSLVSERGGKTLAEMFCVKCKEKKTVPDDKTTLEKTAKGRNMLRAICPTCGTKMTKFTK